MKSEDNEDEDNIEEIKDSIQNKFRNDENIYLNNPEPPIPPNPELRKYKKSFNTKDMRVIDEDTLKIINIEFILKQEINLSNVIKEFIMPKQFIRTSDIIRVL